VAEKDIAAENGAAKLLVKVKKNLYRELGRKMPDTPPNNKGD
jgi:hypothetical protein